MKEELDYLFDHYPANVLSDFKKFHAKNPHVYNEFKALAFEMKATGRTKYSSKMIINVLRWRMDMKSKGDVFKINDKFQSIYARMFVYNHPEFMTFFEFRVRDCSGRPSREEKSRKSKQTKEDT